MAVARGSAHAPGLGADAGLSASRRRERGAHQMHGVPSLAGAGRQPSLAEAEACIERGDGLEEAGDLGGAALEFTRATQLDPSDTEAWSSLGNVLRGLARPAEAAVAYERAAASDPTDPDLLLYRAAALSRCGDLEGAAGCIDAALELMLAAEERDASAVADGWVSRGVAAFGLGRTAEAMAYYDRALAEVAGHE